MVLGVSPRPIWLGPDREHNSLIVDGERVAAFGDIEAVDGLDVERLACPDCVIRPGRINAHTHLYSGLVPLGMPQPIPPPASFVEILEQIWWRLDRALDPEILRAAARYYIAGALLAGTTALIDHHESPRCIEGSLDVLADACQELGMRSLLCYGATERNGGRAEARTGLAECVRFMRDNRRPLVRGLVGLHASFTVSDETIREAGELCRQHDTVLHVHVAEDGADVEDANRRGHTGPLERLIELGALVPGSILAHGVHLDAAQIDKVNELRCWVVQNPRSNRGNGVGYPRAIRRAVRLALGTDGYPADMVAEEEVLREEAARHGEGEADIAFRLKGGTGLIGARFASRFAPLAEGTVADVGAFGDGGVRHLLVAGRPVVRDHRLTTADFFAIEDAAEEESARLWKRLREV